MFTQACNDYYPGWLKLCMQTVKCALNMAAVLVQNHHGCPVLGAQPCLEGPDTPPRQLNRMC